MEKLQKNHKEQTSTVIIVNGNCFMTTEDLASKYDNLEKEIINNEKDVEIVKRNLLIYYIDKIPYRYYPTYTVQHVLSYRLTPTKL